MQPDFARGALVAHPAGQHLAYHQRDPVPGRGPGTPRPRPQGRHLPQPHGTRPDVPRPARGTDRRARPVRRGHPRPPQRDVGRPAGPLQRLHRPGGQPVHQYPAASGPDARGHGPVGYGPAQGSPGDGAAPDRGREFPDGRPGQTADRTARRLCRALQHPGPDRVRTPGQPGPVHRTAPGSPAHGHCRKLQGVPGRNRLQSPGHDQYGPGDAQGQ